MIRSLAVVCACLVVAGVLCAGEEPASPEGKESRAFVPLYSGKDLTGWAVKDGRQDAWRAEGELLSCVEPGGGWLRTDKMYSDFVLKLEYRIPPGGNSGVGLRFPAEGDPAHIGMEIQILDDDARQYENLKPAQYTGGIYYQAAARRGAARPPGEWNAYEITCRGPQVKVVLNGQVINEVNIDDYTTGEGGHKALADRPRIGYLGFQSHGSRVDFRNIELRDLTRATKSGVRYVDLVEGEGERVPAGAEVTVHYTGWLAAGRKFGSSRDDEQPVTLSLKDAIPGWQEGIPGMKVGGRRKIVVPAELAGGEAGQQPKVPEALLIFDVEVLGVK